MVHCSSCGVVPVPDEDLPVPLAPMHHSSPEASSSEEEAAEAEASAAAAEAEYEAWYV